MRYSYEPSTSGWNVVRYRRRLARRRTVQWALGGVTLLLVGAIAGLFLTVGTANALSLVK